MKTNKSILTPEGMYSFAGKALRPCFILAIIVILAAMYVGFFLAPVDATQGNSYRILYIHVACAWLFRLYRPLRKNPVLSVLPFHRLRYEI